MLSVPPPPITRHTRTTSQFLRPSFPHICTDVSHPPTSLSQASPMGMCPPITCRTVWSPAPGVPSTQMSPTAFCPRPRFSPVQVATHTDHSFASGLQTYITFEGRARPAPLAVWSFRAPVLLLCSCHGRFGVAPAYPSIPPNTHTHAATPERPPPAHSHWAGLKAL